jgi:transposase
MEQFTTEQRVLIVKTFYQNGESATQTVRKLRNILGRNEAPNESTVRRLMTKFKTTGSAATAKSPGRNRSRRTEQQIAVVRDSVTLSPGKSIRRRSQQLGIPTTSLHRILHKDLHMSAYKIQLTQHLQPPDHGRRRQFADWVVERLAADENFAKKIIFSDEAHFHLSGFVNKQNCRFWGTENPRIMQQREMHPLRATVWCGFWAGGVLGPFFFEDHEGKAVTINGERYRDMISTQLWPKLEDTEIDNLWFQQDGATCHTARQTLALLHEKFPQRVISLHGDQEWPPRSCDLTPCDFFLWGYVKSQVYANNPRTIPELKAEIRRVIGGIEPHICERVIGNFEERINVCRLSAGGHMADIVFHT